MNLSGYTYLGTKRIEVVLVILYSLANGTSCRYSLYVSLKESFDKSFCSYIINLYKYRWLEMAHLNKSSIYYSCILAILESSGDFIFGCERYYIFKNFVQGMDWAIKFRCCYFDVFNKVAKEEVASCSTFSICFKILLAIQQNIIKILFYGVWEFYFWWYIWKKLQRMIFKSIFVNINKNTGNTIIMINKKTYSKILINWLINMFRIRLWNN